MGYTKEDKIDYALYLSMEVKTELDKQELGIAKVRDVFFSNFYLRNLKLDLESVRKSI